MKLGLFRTFEVQGDARTTFEREVALIKHAEELSFSEVWVAEHHFHPKLVNPSALAMASYLAAATSRIQIGTAAIVLSVYDPFFLAEQAALVDALSGGRFSLGVSRGSPDPRLRRYSGNENEISRSALVTLGRIVHLLRGNSASWKDLSCEVEDTCLAFAPQPELPIFAVSADRDFLQNALLVGVSPIFGPNVSLREVEALAIDLTSAHSHPSYSLFRFLHIGRSREAARREAATMLAPMLRKMGRFSEENLNQLLDDSLIGTLDEVLEGIDRLNIVFRPSSLVFKQIADIDHQIFDLERVASHTQLLTV